MQSQRFFDSGFNVSMIKRSALPKRVITKLLGDTKLVRTLAGHLKTHKVVTMQDLRLPKFDKSRRINQQKVLVLDNDDVKYNIILKETWNGLISPSHFAHLEVWVQTNSMPPKTCFTSKSKTSSLVKIDSNALQQRSWMPSMKRQM
jgi:hypothetical protein